MPERPAKPSTPAKPFVETPKWGVIDLLVWKIVPENLGGGIPFIQRFKDAWVQNNKLRILAAAGRYRFPPPLLAGVCWIEVGGDPNVIDGIAFAVRAFDWSGPDWVDRNFTITRNPAATSFGSVSVQLRTAAQTLGKDPGKMSHRELLQLASLLDRDNANVDLVARLLRQLAAHDGFADHLPSLSIEQVKIIGARYNRGVGLSVSQIKANLSYGNFIVKFWPRFVKLLR